jgi:hypothetical protein
MRDKWLDKYVTDIMDKQKKTNSIFKKVKKNEKR